MATALLVDVAHRTPGAPERFHKWLVDAATTRPIRVYAPTSLQWHNKHEIVAAADIIAAALTPGASEAQRDAALPLLARLFIDLDTAAANAQWAALIHAVHAENTAAAQEAACLLGAMLDTPHRLATTGAPFASVGTAAVRHVVEPIRSTIDSLFQSLPRYQIELTGLALNGVATVPIAPSHSAATIQHDSERPWRSTQTLVAEHNTLQKIDVRLDSTYNMAVAVVIDGSHRIANVDELRLSQGLDHLRRLLTLNSRVVAWQEKQLRVDNAPDGFEHSAKVDPETGLVVLDWGITRSVWEFVGYWKLHDLLVRLRPAHMVGLGLEDGSLQWGATLYGTRRDTETDAIINVQPNVVYNLTPLGAAAITVLFNPFVDLTSYSSATLRVTVQNGTETAARPLTVFTTRISVDRIKGDGDVRLQGITDKATVFTRDDAYAAAVKAAEENPLGKATINAHLGGTTWVTHSINKVQLLDRVQDMTAPIATVIGLLHKTSPSTMGPGLPAVPASTIVRWSRMAASPHTAPLTVSPLGYERTCRIFKTQHICFVPSAASQ